ncbi:MAG: helix-turn-helix domain-containing protein [Gaiellaceae bacterium]
MAKAADPKTDELLAKLSKQMEDVKRLLVIQLIADGVQGAHIAKALGIDPSTISKMVPARDIQTALRKRGSDG